MSPPVKSTPNQEKDFILLLQEVPYHPRSYLERLDSKFETPSILQVRRKDELSRYSKPPIFDERYLVVFNELRVLEANKEYISFRIMLPVLKVETAGQLEDAKFFCKEVGFPFRVFVNAFTKDDAIALIQSHASETVSDAVIKAIIRQVGLSPMRIITAVSVCEQMGYTVANVERYIDKWVYPDLRKLIEALLGIIPSNASLRRSVQYLYLNRHWYRFIRQNLVDELDTVLTVYKDKLEGNLYSENLYNYMEEQHLSRGAVMFALKLFEKVSISSVIALRELIKNSSLMEIVLRLS